MKYAFFLFIFTLSGMAVADVEQTVIYTTSIDSKMRSAKKNYSQANYKKAYKEFNELARLGLKEAQFMTGMMLIKGKGRPKDMVKGISWLYTASEAKSKWVNQADNYFSTVSRDEKRQIQQTVATYIDRFGMDAQLVSCRKETYTGSHIKKVICRKQRDVRTPLYSDDGKLLANVTVQNSPNDRGLTGASAALNGVRAATTR